MDSEPWSRGTGGDKGKQHRNSSGCRWGLTCQLPIVQFQAVEGIGAIEEDVAFGVDTLQLLQGGLASPQTLQGTGAVTEPLRDGTRVPLPWTDRKYQHCFPTVVEPSMAQSQSC